MSGDQDHLLLRLSGSPSVESIGAVTDALRDLVDALAKRPVQMSVESRCVCDTCGAKSEPVDLTDPASAETALRQAGWVRNITDGSDVCPACADLT